jgi:hypothetical protein
MWMNVQKMMDVDAERWLQGPKNCCIIDQRVVTMAEGLLH